MTERWPHENLSVPNCSTGGDFWETWQRLLVRLPSPVCLAMTACLPPFRQSIHLFPLPRGRRISRQRPKCVVIFCAGAVSQLETWDYKPELIKHDGMPLKGGPAVTFQGPAGELAQPQFDFQPRGESGKMVSEMIPHLAKLTDDIAFVHSLTSKSNTHGPAENFLSTGFVLDGFPSLGSWVTYALGSECDHSCRRMSRFPIRGVSHRQARTIGVLDSFLPHFKERRSVQKNLCGIWLCWHFARG